MSPTHLTPTQLTDLNELLRQRHRELSQLVESELHADGTQEISVTTTSDAGWVSADVNADVLIARAERDANELAEITSALDRVRLGGYSFCAACSKDIGYTRLLAHPTARRCLPCQQAVEAKKTSMNSGSKQTG